MEPCGVSLAKIRAEKAKQNQVKLDGLIKERNNLAYTVAHCMSLEKPKQVPSVSEVVKSDIPFDLYYFIDYNDTEGARLFNEHLNDYDVDYCITRGGTDHKPFFYVTIGSRILVTRQKKTLVNAVRGIVYRSFSNGLNYDGVVIKAKVCVSDSIGAGNNAYDVIKRAGQWVVDVPGTNNLCVWWAVALDQAINTKKMLDIVYWSLMAPKATSSG